MRWLLLLFFPICCFAQSEYDSLPPNIYLDSLHYPFTYGVNSGDPLPNQVIIWTRIEPLDYGSQIPVYWEVSTSLTFNNIAASGEYLAHHLKDYTVKIDVAGLKPGSTYYYRFKDQQGNYSVIGRAKTAPIGDIPYFRVAVMSCSSLFSGYFNAYRHLGQRDDIDLVIHLGDYIYDYVDSDEKVRIPSPYPTEPNDLESFRNRHKLYLADPDLRLARQNHSWVVVWDNHDIEVGNPAVDVQAKQAFYEYLPIRVTSPTDSFQIYRNLQFGNLFQLTMLDMDSYEIEFRHDSVNATYLGQQQTHWLQNKLSNNPAIWNLIGSQKMVAGWYNKKLPKPLRILGDDTFFDPSSFDGHAAERDSLLRYIDANNIDNVVVLSGDMHMTFLANLVPDPFQRKNYKKRTGYGAVGVEFMPTSITRGNFDESGIPKSIATVVERISLKANPHHIYCDFVQHGYGVLDITAERIIAEVWYFPKLTITDKLTFGGGFKVLQGKNHWEWGKISKPFVR